MLEGEACGSCGGYMPFGGMCGTCMALKTVQDEEARDTVSCGKCFRGTRNWERKTWLDGRAYCNECLKGVQALHTAENSCMACGKEVAPHEPRIYPPERIQARDEWIKTGQLKSRFVCRQCFESMTARKFGVALRINPRNRIVKRMRVLLGIGGG